MESGQDVLFPNQQTPLFGTSYTWGEGLFRGPPPDPAHSVFSGKPWALCQAPQEGATGQTANVAQSMSVLSFQIGHIEGEDQ